MRASGRRCSSILWDWRRARLKVKPVRAKANRETAVECCWLKRRHRRRPPRNRLAANRRATIVPAEFHLAPDHPIPAKLSKRRTGWLHRANDAFRVI